MSVRAQRRQLIPGVHLTELHRIVTPDGEVRHGLRQEEADFAGFGEAYFSEVLAGHVKGWKQHRLMTMNLIVVQGAVRFLLCSEAGSCEVSLSVDPATAPYGRLTVAPRIWMAFAGQGSGTNLLMNLASHGHDPAEAERAALAVFADRFPDFPWKGAA